MTEWSHDTMNFQQAYKYARQFFLEVKNIHPFYGIEEYDAVDIATLKKVAQLRTKIRKAEFLKASPEIIGDTWRELKEVMTNWYCPGSVNGSYARVCQSSAVS